jgi:uncharacterized protein (TIGR00251 family)
MPNLKVEEVGEKVIFTVKVIPRSSHPTHICGTFDKMLKVKVAAPAEKGKANQHLVDFLAKKIGVKKHTVSIISGHNNPIKKVQILGISTKTLIMNLDLSTEES